jgi:hypothetical protein
MTIGILNAAAMDFSSNFALYAPIENESIEFGTAFAIRLSNAN